MKTAILTTSLMLCAAEVIPAERQILAPQAAHLGPTVVSGDARDAHDWPKYCADYAMTGVAAAVANVTNRRKSRRRVMLVSHSCAGNTLS